MEGKTKEQWMRLCLQPAGEQGPANLIELMKEINRLLKEKEDPQFYSLPIRSEVYWRVTRSRTMPLTQQR
jgi:hypothetical protein